MSRNDIRVDMSRSEGRPAASLTDFDMEDCYSPLPPDTIISLVTALGIWMLIILTWWDRNDLELQKRLLEAKKAKIKAENERKMKIAIASALVLQRHVRGMIGRTRGRRYVRSPYHGENDLMVWYLVRFICEKAYERALESQAHDVSIDPLGCDCEPLYKDVDS